MSPEFAKIVDPLFCRLLDLTENTNRWSLAELKSQLMKAIDDVTNQLGNTQDWIMARYAIVAWVDSEIISRLPAWKDNTLEATYFRSGVAHSRFFEGAVKATERKLVDACECFLLCFMFGFRGVYGDNDPAKIPPEWPRSEEEWQRQVGGFVQSMRTKPDIKWHSVRRQFADPVSLTGRSYLQTMWLFFGAFLVVGGAMAAFKLLS